MSVSTSIINVLAVFTALLPGFQRANHLKSSEKKQKKSPKTQAPVQAALSGDSDTLLATLVVFRFFEEDSVVVAATHTATEWTLFFAPINVNKKIFTKMKNLFSNLNIISNSLADDISRFNVK